MKVGNDLVKGLTVVFFFEKSKAHILTSFTNN